MELILECKEDTPKWKLESGPPSCCVYPQIPAAVPGLHWSRLYDYCMNAIHSAKWALVATKVPAKNLPPTIVVLEKTLESPLDCKKIQPVHPKGNQSWIFTGRTDVEAETPILWPPDAKSWLIGKDWGQEEKGMTEDEMVGLHHQLNGHEFA